MYFGQLIVGAYGIEVSFPGGVVNAPHGDYAVTFIPHDAASTNANELTYEIRTAATGADDVGVFLSACRARSSMSRIALVALGDRPMRGGEASPACALAAAATAAAEAGGGAGTPNGGFGSRPWCAKTMMSCQDMAGSVPPVMFPMDVFSSLPNQTLPTRLPVKALNQALVELLVVPVLPAIASPGICAARPVPSLTTCVIMLFSSATLSAGRTRTGGPLSRAWS